MLKQVPENKSGQVSMTIIGTMLTDDDAKDVQFEIAKDEIETAEKLSPSNSEVKAMKAFVKQMYISVSPYTRSLQWPEVNDLIDKAISLDPNNPRAYYLKGAGVFYTPTLMGGGKDKEVHWI